MKFPSVCLVYNQPVLPSDHPDAASEMEILDTVKRIEAILRDGNFPTSTLPIGYDPFPAFLQLQQTPPDVIFNLFEGFATCTETEAVVAGMFDWLQIPYTGSQAAALSLGRDKFRTKNLLAGAGIPTPAFELQTKIPTTPGELGWPRIVKPAFQDASVGIEQGSVVENLHDYRARIAWVIEHYGPPALVEEFIFGREILVSVIEERDRTEELTILPFSEIVFQPTDQALWPIYSYHAKWDTNSVEYRATPLDVPVILSPDVTMEIERVARACYRLLGCRDYARVDLRLDQNQQIFVLEVNPNPFVNSIAVLDGLEAMKRSHPQFIRDLVWRAYDRGPAKRDASPTHDRLCGNRSSG
ncbi:D-alanine--D-alanine ligase family protein [Tuwongella immobilis]|uniref:ATP-grasp domain-containing protein n=1 Tax=Tuwongella immobilis TaxID=692036 RepID=A0A6C2YJN3_9BACT|nr:ATP-grasp domain-containing protein [Tuwongella immobilis]VIP01584.1 d-alanine--d-alanine ligase : D-alanine-D-alanine ligase OS=Melioribacter roseus (strain JCM 17771 / P3M-2) GN=MROS_1522 PE=4 SV=1: Dala_Dala_lig_C [Tuwongella immobilis]VTR98842.1 d-alanine--d-alanine ligase : D-alanine-D-alanine ligase OS=Melioribacter roseus (strain JCM 17771 / P3M-2) GN=MROS_1522 PE=4 SV=1: Dala_Dala_lig_C [Tuwongella immobilis]